MRAQAPQALQASQSALDGWLDVPLLVTVGVLCAFGVLMMMSASLAVSDEFYGDPLYLFYRQLTFMGVAFVCAACAYVLPLSFWFDNAGWLLVAALLVLVLVLIPDVGRQVNGSRRWLDLGGFTVQASEVAKLGLMCYISAYIARHHDALRTTFLGVCKPVALTALVAMLLLLEPDFGTAVIVGVTVLTVLFLAMARLPYLLLFGVTGVGVVALLLVSAPYRLARFKAFIDPWASQFGDGYQLVQSLIAIGGGAMFGRGLGDSVQKFLYLPEAHTDFIFAIIAEELGFPGVVGMVLIFWVIVWRCFAIAGRAMEKGLVAPACLAYGVGMWVGMQAFVNMAVNLGLLPTKGISLPLVSVGGSGLCVTLVAFALVQRVHKDTVAVQAKRRPATTAVLRGRRV